jgi:transcriptional regulator with XRE-family HTH domain
MMRNELGSPRHETLRRLLYERPLKAGLTQKQLADRMGYSQAFISAVERGDQRVSVLQLVDYAEALGFDPRSAIRRVALTPRKATNQA